MSFQTFAVIQHVPDRSLWHVVQPLVYNGEVNIVVPDGFETDLASVPRFFWILIPHADKHIVEGSIIHDYMYSGNTAVTKRSQADRILRQACKDMGAPAWYCWVVWAGVRIGGGSAWKADHKGK